MRDPLTFIRALVESQKLFVEADFDANRACDREACDAGKGQTTRPNPLTLSSSGLAELQETEEHDRRGDRVDADLRRPKFCTRLELRRVSDFADQRKTATHRTYGTGSS